MYSNADMASKWIIELAATATNMIVVIVIFHLATTFLKKVIKLKFRGIARKPYQRWACNQIIYPKIQA